MRRKPDGNVTTRLALPTLDKVRAQVSTSLYEVPRIWSTRRFATGRHLVRAACLVVFGGLLRDGKAASLPEAGSAAEVVGATVLGSPWASR